MSHITIAANAATVTQMFNAIRQNFTFAKSDSGSFGPFSASYDIKLHLEGGSIQLNDDDTLEVQDMDVVWDILQVGVCFNLPGFCVGGDCIIPDPFDGCWVSLPKLCIGGPICINPDFSGLVTEVNDIKGNLVARYFVDPARTPGQTDLDAELAGHSNKWQIFLNPVFVHVDPIDLPATINNVIDKLLKDAISNLLWFLPGWAQDLLWDLIGPVLDLFKSIIGFGGEVFEFFQNLLNSIFDLVGIVETAIADYFANKNPIHDFEDPYPIMDATATLIPVKIPIRNPALMINSKEVVLTADVGA